jgi:ferredoxin
MKNLSTNKTSVTQIVPGVFVRISPASKYAVVYHRDECTGIGTCSTIAGNTFEMNYDDNVAEVVVTEQEDADELILAAAESCPVLAIKIYEKSTLTQIFPAPIEGDQPAEYIDKLAELLQSASN